MSDCGNSYIDAEMRKRRYEFCDRKDLNVFCASWNVNAKIFSEDIAHNNLNIWLCDIKDGTIPDIYAICLQEIVDLNIVNIAFDGSDSEKRTRYWSEKILSCLNATYGISFHVITYLNLVGIFMIVIVKSDLVYAISDVRSTMIPLGVMGYGNKGGVLTRLNYHQSSICFIGSHLRHETHDIAGRNGEVALVLTNSVFAAEEKILNLSTMSNDYDEAFVPRESAEEGVHGWFDNDKYYAKNVLDHDYIFWLGDLNYRIADDSGLKDHSIYPPSDNIRDWLDYFPYDTLNLERFKSNVFLGFEEGEVTFSPTYKYKPGTNNFSGKRAPAWCDRVLYKIHDDLTSKWSTSSNYEWIVVKEYESIQSITISDHKPIRALFRLLTLDANRRNEVESYLSVLETLAEAEDTIFRDVDGQCDERLSGNFDECMIFRDSDMGKSEYTIFCFRFH